MEKKINKFKIPKNTIPAPTGDGYEYFDEEITDPKTGEVKVIKNRVHIYSLIQKAKETCDMNYILKMLSKGDTTVLEQTNGVYLDSTDLPQDINEAQMLKDTAISLYNQNPELKELYKTSEEYERALFSGVDIANKVIDLRIKKLQNQKVVNQNVKDVKTSVDEVKEK